MKNFSRAATRAIRLPFNRRGTLMLGLTVVATSLMLAAAQPSHAHEYKAGDIEVDHPWSRATPPGAKVAAGYFVIRNKGSESDRLVSVSSEISARGEIHEMSVSAEGVMTMRPVPAGIEIPAGGEVALKPGSYHLMFMELKQGPKEGERFKGVLTFEKAGSVEVEFAVEAMGAGGGHGGGHPASHEGQHGEHGASHDDHGGHSGHGN